MTSSLEYTMSYNVKKKSNIFFESNTNIVHALAAQSILHNVLIKSQGKGVCANCQKQKTFHTGKYHHAYKGYCNTQFYQVEKRVFTLIPRTSFLSTNIESVLTISCQLIKHWWLYYGKRHLLLLRTVQKTDSIWHGCEISLNTLNNIQELY